MSNPFLDRLRSETASSHRSLEQNSYAAALMGEQVNIDDYADYLEKMYGFVPVFESTVFPVLKDIVNGIDELHKTHLLQADLLQLGRKLVNVQRIDASRMAVLSSSIGTAMGSLYVMEGSVLGGMVICKHVQKYLGGTIDGSTHYFTAYGPSTGSRWKQFLDLLCDSAKGREDEVIQGAIVTFHLMNEWMTEKTVISQPG